MTPAQNATAADIVQTVRHWVLDYISVCVLQEADGETHAHSAVGGRRSVREVFS